MPKLAGPGAYWQALLVNLLKHGTNLVESLRSAVEVMRTYEFASFSNSVLQAENDSMETLQMMQEVPYLAKWQQANAARAESGQGAHHATSVSTDSSGKLRDKLLREQSQLRYAKTAGIASQDPVGDMRTEMQGCLNSSVATLQLGIQRLWLN